ncbi:hypothetical protein E3N88_08998 [Mikania micrantha]|uniref:Uncharacterized protein n=1 Tax=Mikania micrantha TaxID=192012 RepID=A0A5N6PIF8_9ASTR|nr:hypothetical protein E3N88_08998 [Mikania micrantha]
MTWLKTQHGACSSQTIYLEHPMNRWIKTVTVAHENYVINDYARNDERGRKPCSKRSPGLPGIEKRRKFSKYWISGLVAVRDGGVELPSRYAMHEKYLNSRKTSRYAKPKFAPRRGTRRMRRWNELLIFIRLHVEEYISSSLELLRPTDENSGQTTIKSPYSSPLNARIAPGIISTNPDHSFQVRNPSD